MFSIPCRNDFSFDFCRGFGTLRPDHCACLERQSRGREILRCLPHSVLNCLEPRSGGRESLSFSPLFAAHLRITLNVKSAFIQKTGVITRISFVVGEALNFGKV
jgi:hypothetical protein